MTILIPCKDMAVLLPKAIMSVANQTCHEWDLQVLVDRGSSDSSYNTAKSVRDSLKSKGRVHVNVSQKPGLTHVYQELIDRAQPDDGLCGFLDADDQLVPEALAAMLPQYRLEQDMGYVWSQFVHSSTGYPGYSKPLPPNTTIAQAFYSGWWGAQHWRTFRREAYLKAKVRLHTDVPLAVDYNMALVLASSGYKGRFVNKILYIYYNNPRGISRSRNADQRRCYHDLLGRFRGWYERQHQ